MRLTAKRKKEEKSKKVFIDCIPYVWVEGYKGTDENMCCRGYQYELNKEFTCEGKPILCNNGFHFCKYLEQVADGWNYWFDGKNRFFKVRALIPSKYAEWNYTACVAKKIIFLEELGYDQLKKYIHQNCPMIKTKEDWIKSREMGYRNFCKDIFKTEMIKYEYSEAFINTAFRNTNEKECDAVINYAKKLYEVNTDKDLAGFLINRFIIIQSRIHRE